MPTRLLDPNSYKTILTMCFSTLMIACAGQQQTDNDQVIEPSFQERVTECSKIADRSERDRCLYGN
jgi:hypothetical protein